MPKVCQISGKRTRFSVKSSHANNKTNHKFFVNLQKTRVFLTKLNIFIKLNVSTSKLREITTKGWYTVFRKAYEKGTLDKKLWPLIALYNKPFKKV